MIEDIIFYLAVVSSLAGPAYLILFSRWQDETRQERTRHPD